ncbi:BatA domain-containing protein [Lysinibacillus boronitolerans]|uniref:BatA domain-containing protein n=1 Tax=Lysinibacillus boronitolerans TaxID=309788 RepID=UPI001EE6630C|nr:BatA domain-containing protein [Lysinibacillus boronitolerans]
MGFSQIIFSWTAIIPVIVLLYYFFRKKYTDQTVSSTLFWSEIMQETRVSPYLKHLQKKCPTIFTASCFTATCFGIDESLYKKINHCWCTNHIYCRYFSHNAGR